MQPQWGQQGQQLFAQRFGCFARFTLRLGMRASGGIEDGIRQVEHPGI